MSRSARAITAALVLLLAAAASGMAQEPKQDPMPACRARSQASAWSRSGWAPTRV